MACIGLAMTTTTKKPKRVTVMPITTRTHQALSLSMAGKMVQAKPSQAKNRETFNRSDNGGPNIDLAYAWSRAGYNVVFYTGINLRMNAR